jgi:hypothetical protein
MRRTAVGLLIQLTVCCDLAYPQVAPPRADLSCVSSLELPTHGLLAARARQSGTVTASLQIGPGGSLAKSHFASDDPALEREVQIALNLSRFKKSCAGKKVEIIFSFELEDPPADSVLPPDVRFLPPNRFELVFRRVSPNLDPVSAPPPHQ